MREEIFIGTKLDIAGIFGRDDGAHAGEFFSFGSIDTDDPRVRMRTTDHFTNEHVREADVKGVFGLARDDPPAVNARNTFANGVDIFLQKCFFNRGNHINSSMLSSSGPRRGSRQRSLNNTRSGRDSRPNHIQSLPGSARDSYPIKPWPT